jgi:hypothetical protein
MNSQTTALPENSADYFVIADSSDPFTTFDENRREGRMPLLEVVHVEREACELADAQAQLDRLLAICRDSQSLGLHTVSARSAGRAADVVRREHAVAVAAERMAEAIDTHLERGARGWIAVHVADGTSDGALYADADDARRAQKDAQACTYLPISPLFPWSVEACVEHLTAMTHLGHGCMVHGRPTCH